jgi:transcriptional regulator with XRE-family HTH domain
VSQAIRGAAAVSSAVAGRKGFKAELDGLRDRMRGLGFGDDEVAAEVSRRYPVSLRQACRLARGWTLDQAAARFNEIAASAGTDPQGRAYMTGPHLCEYEKWPDSERKPSVYVLCVLARVYETDPVCLLDLADHEGLDPKDRLTLIRSPLRPRAAGPSGETLAEPPGPEGGHAEPGGLAVGAGGYGHGLSLSLPYLPGRLVIEISDPAAAATPAHAEPGSGHLALVQDSTPGKARAEAAGR